VSDEQTGAFALTLTGLKMGDRIGLVSVKKREMMVFNQHAVDEWSVRKEPLMLILCNADEFERQKENLINIGRQEAKKKYDRQKAELEAKFNASEIQLTEYESALDKAYEELERLQKNVGEYADLFARIDESEIDTLAQHAMELYHQGQVEEAIRLFEQGNYMERLDKALQHSQQADELKIVSEQAKEQATQDSLKALQSLKAQIEAYKLNNEWDKAGELLKGLTDRLNTIGDNLDYAYFCISQNNFKEAETYCHRALVLYKNRATKEDFNYIQQKALIISYLGVLYHNTQRFSDSESAYKEALETYRRLSKANPQAYEPDFASTLNNLGNLYSDTQRFSDGESAYKEALETYRRLSKANPQAYEPDLARTLNNLGNLYSDTQRFSDGESAYKEALETYRRLSKANPQAYEPDLASTLNNLGALYRKNLRFSDSESAYKEALEIRRRLSQATPQAYEPDLARTLNNLGALYRKNLRFSDSESAYKEALEIRRRLSNANPQAYEPALAVTLYNLGGLYRATQRFSDSESAYKEALETYRRLSKANPLAYEPDVADTQYNIGLLKNQEEKYDEAIPSFEEASELYRRIKKTNPAHQQNSTGSLYYLSILYTSVSNHVRAYQINKELLPILKDLYVTDSLSYRDEYAKILGNHSFNAIFMKQYAEAEHCAREGLEVDSTQHWIASNLAASFLFQCKYEEAETIYRKYKDELKDSFLDDFRQFAEAGVIPKEREEDVERIKRILNE